MRMLQTDYSTKRWTRFENTEKDRVGLRAGRRYALRFSRLGKLVTRVCKVRTGADYWGHGLAIEVVLQNGRRETIHFWAIRQVKRIG